MLGKIATGVFARPFSVLDFLTIGFASMFYRFGLTFPLLLSTRPCLGISPLSHAVRTVRICNHLFLVFSSRETALPWSLSLDLSATISCPSTSVSFPKE